MDNETTEAWNKAIAEAMDAYDADIYVYSAAIDDDGFGALTKSVARCKERNNALLILVTNGGLANPAYQIARFLHSQYEKVTIWVPSRCKSAGTLVALGAHELLMDSFSELGPLDVQLFKQNEIVARKSGLLSRSSLDALAGAAFDLYEQLMIGITLKSGGNVSFKLASELSASMTASLMAPIYGQVNADTIGSEFRDLNIAFEYGERLVELSGNAGVEAVYNLVHNYPAHDFIIDAKEASDRLLHCVNEPSDKLYALIPFIHEVAYDEANPSVVGALKPKDLGGAEAHGTDDIVGEAEEPGTEPAPPMDVGGGGDRTVDPEAAREGGSGSEDGQPETRRAAQARRGGTGVPRLRPINSN